MKAIKLVEEFKKYKLGPYIEVPCSILSPVLKILMHDRKCEVFNPANEAIAMGMAAGSFLATNRIPMVLMQNSGLSNSLNALTSLNQIYKIPVLYLISWRGQPGIKDAPEHLIIGAKLTKILKTFDIPYEMLTANSYKKQIRSIIEKIKVSAKPAALLLKSGLIEQQKQAKITKRQSYGLSREEAIKTIIKTTAGKAGYVSTNGYISREAYYVLGTMGKEGACPSFYMLGSMGHALPIALGLGRYLKRHRKVIVLDGDGGCLMHLGAMASVTKIGPGGTKIIHVVLDNKVYASTGGQPTVSEAIDFVTIAHGCGYRNAYSIKSSPRLRRILASLLKLKGPSFIQLQINNIAAPKPRIPDTYSCEQIKQSFINLIR